MLMLELFSFTDYKKKKVSKLNKKKRSSKNDGKKISHITSQLNVFSSNIWFKQILSDKMYSLSDLLLLSVDRFDSIWAF